MLVTDHLEDLLTAQKKASAMGGATRFVVRFYKPGNSVPQVIHTVSLPIEASYETIKTAAQTARNALS